VVNVEVGRKQQPVYIQTDKQPSCFSFYFDEPTAKLFITVQDEETGKYFYFRNCYKPVTELHIRMPKTPDVCRVEFFTDNPFGIKTQLKSDCKPRRVDWSDPKLKPQVMRNYRLEDIRTIYTDLGYRNGSGTPARHFVTGPNRGIIEYDRNAAEKLPQQIWEFIKRHELAHYFYDDEDLADLWALYKFAEDGYSMSQAENALVHVLDHSPDNVNRIMKLYQASRDFEARYYE